MLSHGNFILKYGFIIYLSVASMLIGCAFSDSSISSPASLIACLVATAAVLIFCSTLACMPCSYEHSCPILSWIEQEWQNLKRWFNPRPETSLASLYSSQIFPASNKISKDWKRAVQKLEEATENYDQAKNDWKNSALLFERADGDYNIIKDKWLKAQNNLMKLSNYLKATEEDITAKKDELSKVGKHWSSCNDDLISAKNTWIEANQQLSNITDGDFKSIEKAQNFWNEAKENLNQAAERWNKASDALATSKENLDKVETVLKGIKAKWNDASDMLRKAKEMWNGSMDKINKSKVSLQRASDELNMAQDEFKKTDEDMNRLIFPSLDEEIAKPFSKHGDSDDVSATVPTKVQSQPAKKTCSFIYGKFADMECKNEIKKTAVISIVATLLIFALMGMIFHFYPELSNTQFAQNSWSKITGFFNQWDF